MAPSRGGRSNDRQHAPRGKSSATSKTQQRPPNTSTTEASESRRDVPLSLQQSILGCIKAAFHDVLNPSSQDSSLPTLLQEVKGHLYNRDFATAFGRQDYLEAYAARWSASRALGYIEIFAEAIDALGNRAVSVDTRDGADNTTPLQRLTIEDSEPHGNDPDLNMVCLGGGAGAELCAFAALPHLVQLKQVMNITVVDRADWTSVLSKLNEALTIPLKPSQHASVLARTAVSEPLVDQKMLSIVFHNLDILSPSESVRSQLSSSCSNANIVTLAFTLNELYTTSISATQSFLLHLTASVTPGTLLLVIDSPGSYSTVTINGNEKKYPMAWLLEHTLLTSAPKALADDEEDDDSREDKDGQQRKQKDPTPVWKLVTSTPSTWFRLPKELKYPLELENMRYQMSSWKRL